MSEFIIDSISGYASSWGTVFYRGRVILDDGTTIHDGGFVSINGYDGSESDGWQVLAHSLAIGALRRKAISHTNKRFLGEWEIVEIEVKDDIPFAKNFIYTLERGEMGFAVSYIVSHEIMYGDPDWQQALEYTVLQMADRAWDRRVNERPV